MRIFDTKLNQLESDSDQFEAYLSDVSTVVLAGPGSGKTTVLTMKIMKLLYEKIREPRGLACLTFTREAANEFQNRLAALGHRHRKNVFLGTVHSFCIAEVISPYGHLYNYDYPLPLKIIATKEKRKIFDKVKNDLGFAEEKVGVIDMDKERSLKIRGLSKVDIPSYDIALQIAIEYEKRLHAKGFVDFIDLIIYSTSLIQDHEFVRKGLEAKFPWILIDEYQDLGKPLHEMIFSLFSLTKINIFAVGDPDQSIYSFSGAIPNFLIELSRQTGINKIQLRTNYRSNQDIVDASEVALNISDKRKYIAGTRKKEKADFQFITCQKDMQEQFQVVAQSIVPNCVKRGVPYDEISVLVGYNTEVVELSKVFEKHKIPYYVTKHEFERSDIVSWLERCALWVSNKSGVSFNELNQFWDAFLKTHLDGLANEGIDRKVLFHYVLTSSSQYESSLAKWLKFVVNSLDLLSILSKSEIYPDEVDNIVKLIKLAEEGTFIGYDVTRFGKLGKPDNQITLSTRHSSKGLEFEVVILLGMEEGRFPDYRKTSVVEIQEEHRIFFVCISRAKKSCYLVRSLVHTIPKRDGGIWEKKCQKSRFWVSLEDKYANESNSLYSKELISLGDS